MKLPIYVTDAFGTPAPSLTFSGAEVQVVVDNAAIATAAGAVREVGYPTTGAGRGAYYYVTVPGDVAGERAELSIAKAGVAPYAYTLSTRERAELQIGGTDAQWGIPVFLASALTGAPMTAITPGAGELLVSIDGAAWTNALGAWSEIGAGKYRYLPASGERTTAGLWMLLAVPASALPYIYAAQAGGAIPQVDAITPTPNVAPGAPGGFSANYATASETAIVIDLIDDELLTYAAVYHVQPDASRKVIYRGGNFEVGYKSYSTQELVSGHVRLHIRADAGWPPGYVEIDGDLVDSDGNVGVLA